MPDKHLPQQPTNDTEQPSNNTTESDTKRRKLLSSVLSASALIVTTANKPAWATDRCTRSALNSANLSGQHTIGGCGRSAGFWRNRTDWPTGCSRADAFTNVFGSYKYKGVVLFINKSLADVINMSGSSDSNPANIGLHVVGAYCNAKAFPKTNPNGKGYAYTPEQVVSMFQTAAGIANIANSPTAFETLKNTLQLANDTYDNLTDWP